MPEPKLFQPIAIGDKTVSNRIVIAPMCQYSATDGQMTDWHLIHLGGLALSGAGILTIEATGVLPEGRITYGDVGLYDDATEAAMARVLKGSAHGRTCPSPSSWRMPGARRPAIVPGTVARSWRPAMQGAGQPWRPAHCPLPVRICRRRPWTRRPSRS